MYNPSKRILAGILLCSHTLISCFSPIVDKQSSRELNPRVPIKQHSYNTNASWNKHDEQLTASHTAQSQEEVTTLIIQAGEQIIKKGDSFTETRAFNNGYETNSFDASYNSDQLDTGLKPVGIYTYPKHQSNYIAGGMISNNQHHRTSKFIRIGLNERQKKLVGKTWALKLGQIVTFYEESGVLKAKVREELGSFRRTLALLVYLGNIQKSIQSRHIQVITPKNTGYVLIDQGGLMGGMMKPSKEEEIEDHHDRPAVANLKEAISQELLDLDGLIEKYLIGITQEETPQKDQEIKQLEKQFKKAKNLIDELEGEADELHGHFRHIYHIKRASFFKAIGKEKEAKKEENLVEKFKNIVETNTPVSIGPKVPDSNVPDQPKMDGSKLFDNEEGVDEAKLVEEKEKILADITKNQILEEGVVEGIRHNLQEIDASEIKDFFECQQIINKVEDIKHLVDEMTIKLDEGKEIDTKGEKIVVELQRLKNIVDKQIYKKSIKFFETILNCDKPEDILFNNLSLTEENVTKRFREIHRRWRFLHPDKNHDILDKDKDTALDLCKLINHCKDLLLKKLAHGKESFDLYENKGNEFWRASLDYKYAKEGKWHLLETLKKEEIEHYSLEELEKLKIQFAKSAYEAYRVCCKIADKEKELKKQIKLRGYMALCLYASNQFLEAQIYSIAAIRLIMQKSHSIDSSDLYQAKKIFNKVRGLKLKEKEETPLTTALVKVDEKSSTRGDIHSFLDKIRIKNAINRELEELLSTQLTLKSDRNIVNYQSSPEEILRVKRRGTNHKVAGKLTAFGGGGLGVAVAGGSVWGVLEGVGVVSGIAFGGPIVAIPMGLATIGLGMWGGHRLWKKGNAILEEPKMREKLNNIMEKALKAYDQGNYQLFITVLSSSYSDQGESLINFKGGSCNIDPQKIIDDLLKHGFRPDGIAYLLNLIGEAFISRQIKIEGLTKKDLYNKAPEIFQGCLSESLQEAAKKLDKRIHELRIKSLKSYWHQLSDLFLLKDYSNIAKDHLRDAQEMPFNSRLEEMKNIAQLNKAIIHIIRDSDSTELQDSDELAEARKLIYSVRNSVDSNYQFFAQSKIRLEAVEEFLWVISGQDIPEDKNLNFLSTKEPKTTILPIDEETKEPKPTTSPVDEETKEPKPTTSPVDEKTEEPKPTTSPADQVFAPNNYLTYLNESLNKAITDQERIAIYHKKADFYIKEAQKEATVNRLAGLHNWQEAQSNYEEIRRLNAQDTYATIGLANCLLNLSKYSRVVNLLKGYANSNLTKIANYWIMGSMAYLKQGDYQKAEEFIVEALKIDPANNIADKQRKLIKALQKNVGRQATEEYKNVKNKVEEAYFNKSRKQEEPYYKILSIDGGGIRGTIPALWLCEIERRTRRPISHLFNMAAGTSTGGIIAAGLSAPFLKVYQESTIPGSGSSSISMSYELPSLYKPRYSAADILELYTKQSQNIFTTNSSWLSSIFNNTITTKYTDQGRLNMFREYFGSTKFDQSLMDLVIPAASDKNKSFTYLFNSRDSKNNPDKNETFVNGLMATSAAPTFFPAYQISGKGEFYDGGLQLNNPAGKAYWEAKKYGIPMDKIFVLSMGTGTCIPDPLNPELYSSSLFWAHNPELYSGSLFWAANLHKVVLGAQEGNTDMQMRQDLGNQYYKRWQVWLEEPISLDDYRKESIDKLLEIGQQHIEELYASEDNSMNNTLEFLEKEYEKRP